MTAAQTWEQPECLNATASIGPSLYGSEDEYRQCPFTTLGEKIEGQASDDAAEQDASNGEGAR